LYNSRGAGRSQAEAKGYTQEKFWGKGMKGEKRHGFVKEANKKILRMGSFKAKKTLRNEGDQLGPGKRAKTPWRERGSSTSELKRYWSRDWKWQAIPKRIVRKILERRETRGGVN